MMAKGGTSVTVSDIGRIKTACERPDMYGKHPGPTTVRTTCLSRMIVFSLHCSLSSAHLFNPSVDVQQTNIRYPVIRGYDIKYDIRYQSMVRVFWASGRKLGIPSFRSGR